MHIKEKNKEEERKISGFPVIRRGTPEHGSCGHHMKVPSFIPSVEGVPVQDRLVHAGLGKISGLSPASLGLAYADWLVHLALAPGKQTDLVRSIWDKTALMAAYARCEILGHEHGVCPMIPLPQDRRFEDEGWKIWPYNFYQQAFLQMERWWQEAADVRGITRHHEAVLPFIARQILDMWSPLNFPLTNPRVTRTTIEQGGANISRGIQNFMDDCLRLAIHAQAMGIEKYSVGENVAVTGGKIIYQNRLIELIQYAPATTEVYAEPVLLVPAWIMKYYILDLSPENSLVKYLVDKGHSVFMISWKNPGPEDRDLGFEDYLDLGIMDALKAIKAIVPGKKVHAAGYCLGGTLLAIAAASTARDGDDILGTLTMFTAQVDFEEAGELLMFTDESQLTYLEDIMWEKGYLDGRHMAETFQMLRSRDLIWSRIVEEYMLGKRRVPNDLMAWNEDTTRMPFRMHSQYLRSLFLNNDLSEGHFIVRSNPVALSDIHIPVFSVGTQHDHISPWRSVYKIHLYTDTDVAFVLASGGHNAGIVSEPGHPNRSYQIAGRKGHEKYIPSDEWCTRTPIHEGSWWPAWQRWLAAHSSGKESPPAMGASGKGYRVLRDAPGAYVMMK